MRIIKPSIERLWVTDNALYHIEYAGRTCYNSYDNITDDSSETFIRNLIKKGHLSVLEHASASYKIVCDRAIANELVRHRLSSFSQQSTRYCNFSRSKFGGEISVIEPPTLTEKEYEEWYECCTHCETTYLNLVMNHFTKPDIARSVLPNCLATEIDITCNFREWRHIFSERYYNKNAHIQMREIIGLIKNDFGIDYPVIIEDLEEKFNEIST